MMKALRKAAVAVMFSILIVAFALWGVSGYMDRQQVKPLAKVGDIEITPQVFQRTYQRALSTLSERAKHRITSKEAAAIGLPTQVMEGLVQDAALDWEAKKLGLGLSPEGLRQIIFSKPIFQDESGKFSREKYDQFLQRINYTDTAFEYELRADLIRQQLRGIFDRSAVIPQALLDAFNRYSNEERTINYFRLPREAVGEAEAPSAETLQSYYNDHKAQFTAPEYRKVSVVAIAPQTVKDKVKVADDEVRATYDSHKQAYAVPERRKIEMVAFQTKQAADEAEAKLKSGKDFLEVAKEAGFKQPDVDLGLLSRKELTEKYIVNDKIENAVFSLPKGGISAPIEGPISTVIVRVLEIVPAQEKSFDEVKDQIRNTIVGTRTQEEMSKLTKAFEDERTAGTPITEIAKKLGLPVYEATLDSRGVDAQGNAPQMPGVPASNLATAAFKSDVGVENEALRLSSGGYAWFDVNDIVKARQKTLDEVKPQVEAAGQKERIRNKVSEKAEELVKRLESGESIADVAKLVNAQVQESKPLKRGGAEPSLPNTAVAQAFALAEGGVGSTAISEGTSRIIFQVAKVTPPASLDEAAADNMRKRLGQITVEDDFAAFVAGIEEKAGASIDHKSLASFVGSGAADFGDY